MIEEIEFVKGVKHTAHGLNFYLSYFDDIAKLLPREDYCFIVGGWVRDRLLGEPVGYSIDVDLLVTCDPTHIARRFADMVGGFYFEFEKKGLLRRPTVATVILRLPPYKYRFDFAQIKGRDVEKALIEDLRSRDFTCNAIAVSIDDVLSIGAKQTILYDPTGGIEDLEKGILRPVSLKNLEEDPVRLIRGFRLSFEKDLELTQDFLDFVKKKGHIIRKAPPERVSLELFKILRHRKAGSIIEHLYKNALLEHIFPELQRLKEIKDQGEHHIYPLDEHVMRVMFAVDEVIENRERYLHVDFLKDLGTEHVMGEFSDLELIKLSALFHDIAKPHTFEIRDGKITFYNHDKFGAEMVREIGKRMRWGGEVTEFVAKMVENHLRPFYLRESLQRGQLTDRGRAKFWRECQDFAPHLFLHAVADALGSGDDEEEIRALLETIHDLCEYKRNRYDHIPLEPLLNGKEIMELFNLPQGPIIGKVKKLLEQAQLDGLVKDKAEAIEYVRKLLEEGAGYNT